MMTENVIGPGPSVRKKARTRRVRRGAAVVAAVCVIAGGALALAGPAHAGLAGPGPANAGQAGAGPAAAASPSPDGGVVYELVNGITHQCLEAFTNTATKISTFQCDGEPEQTWTALPYHLVKGPPLAAYVFVNDYTLLCLQNNGYGQGYGNLHNAASQKKCARLRTDVWVDYPGLTSTGSQFMNARTGLCLESDQYGNAYAQVCNQNHWQFWQMVPVPAAQG
jgi:hypothetical protein